MKKFRQALVLLHAGNAILIGQDPSVIYSPIGKRDPFRRPSSKSVSLDAASKTRLEPFSLEQLQLRAILQGMGRNRAMFEDPDGRTHIFVEGEILAREKGTVSRILSREVIITLRTFNYLGNESLVEKVVSLPSDDDQSGAAIVPKVNPVSKPKGEK